MTPRQTRDKTMNKITMTIKRPEGHTETIDVTAKFENGINDFMFNRAKKATAEAGKGEILSYNIELDAESKAIHARLDKELGEEAKQAKWFSANACDAPEVN